MDFLCFYFPFFYIHWLMGYIWASPVYHITTTEYRFKFRFLRPSVICIYVDSLHHHSCRPALFFMTLCGNVSKRSILI